MITYFVILSGDKFFPRKLSMIGTLSVVGVREPGQPINARGGSAYDYGSIRLSGENLSRLLNDASEILMDANGSVEEVEVNILYLYNAQCNFEISADDIIKIGKLKAVLTISCDKM